MRFESFSSTSRYISLERHRSRDSSLNTHILSYQKTLCATWIKCKVVFSTQFIQFHTSSSIEHINRKYGAPREKNRQVRGTRNMSYLIGRFSFHAFFKNMYVCCNCSSRLHLSQFRKLNYFVDIQQNVKSCIHVSAKKKIAKCFARIFL